MMIELTLLCILTPVLLLWACCELRQTQKILEELRRIEDYTKIESEIIGESKFL